MDPRVDLDLDRYGHLLPELDEAVATAFDQSLTESALPCLSAVGDDEVGGV